jgi:hypothetical protein
MGMLASSVHLIPVAVGLGTIAPLAAHASLLPAVGFYASAIHPGLSAIYAAIYSVGW